MIKILIVDDEFLVRIGVKTTLEEIGIPFDIKTAEDGMEALHALDSFHPQLAFVDIQMPKLNGLDFIKAAIQRYPDTHFVILTCLTDLSNYRAAMQLHVKDYIVKTEVSREKILRLISPYLNENEIVTLNNAAQPRENLDHSSDETSLYIRARSFFECRNYQQSYTLCLYRPISDENTYSPTLDQKIIMEIVDDYGQGLLIEDGEDRLFLFAAFDCPAETADLLVRQMAQQLKESLRIYLNITIQIDYYPCKDAALLQDALTQARSILFDLEASKKLDRDVSQNKAIISKAKQYINIHLEESFGLQDVASHIGLSPNYFSRLFRDVTGETFIEYCIRKRIDRAKQHIADGEKIFIAAQHVGYMNYSHFSRLFKKQEGISPEQYRQSLQK